MIVNSKEYVSMVDVAYWCDRVSIFYTGHPAWIRTSDNKVDRLPSVSLPY
jgi:hypothetical protein